MDLDRIIKFRLDGSYVGEIAKKGEAPGEYLGAQAIRYDSESKSLLVAAHFNHALLKYSEEGELIGSAHFPFPFYVNATDTGVWVLSHGGFIQSGNNGNVLKIMGYRLDKHLVVTDSILVKNVPLSGKETMGRYILQQYISSFDREPGIFLAVIMNEDLQRDTLYTIRESPQAAY